uniref:NrS-1 polymerase-like helicase domain-containing protein n=1 Tax=Rhizophagus irregularis (strain DAOM 181602 / DAOM 197198 / MUCL 43194) TaxID=747089 RepID=U9UAF5_RHIID
MIRPPNDESEVIDNSPLLAVPETESVKYASISNETTIAEFELVETLLQEASIEGYSLSYPSENFPNKFPLSRISPSHCPICDREHDSDHGYIIRNKKSYSFFCYRANNDKEPGYRKPSKKLTISETALDREQKLPIACIQTTSRLWVLKTEDTNGGLYFDMVPKLDLAKYEVNLVELGGEPVKLINLIDRAVTKGFLAKPAPEINKEIMDPILWHVKNVICSGDERLNEYIWNWWAYLVQKPENKPRTILVLKSTLQQCGKNIITDFIARKLIVMNETGMSNGEWHRFNGHLKSLITERMVAIERKGLETIRINDYAGYMVTSNQDAPLKIDIEDSRIVCFDVSACCRGNIPYFDRLGEILDHPDAPGVVMSYLLSRNLTNWKFLQLK